MSARDTLLEHLSPRQRADYTKLGSFLVHGSDRFKRSYLISRHTQAVVTSGKAFWGNSPIPWAYDLPSEDRMLALKLLIECDERYFRQHACVTL